MKTCNLLCALRRLGSCLQTVRFCALGQNSFRTSEWVKGCMKLIRLNGFKVKSGAYRIYKGAGFSMTTEEGFDGYQKC